MTSGPALDRDWQALALESVEDAVVVTSLDGVVRFWNAAAARLFGWESEEMVGRPLLERFPAGTRAEVAALLEEIANGREWADELEGWRKDGARVWVDARVKLLRDEHGEPLGILGVSRDVSGRRRAEVATDGQAAFRQAVLDALAANVVVVGRDGRIRAVNEAWAAHARSNARSGGGVRHVEVGDDYLGVCERAAASGQPEAKAALEGILDVLAGRRDRFVLDYECAPPGERAWAQMTVTPLEADGDREEVVIAHADVTALRLSERAARRAADRLEVALRGAQLGVWEWDVQADRVAWSSETHTIFGAEAFDGTLASFLELVHPAERAGVLERALAGDAPMMHEYRIVRPGGEVRWIEDFGNVARDDDGTPVSMIGVVRDVTDRKQAELELERQALVLAIMAEGVTISDRDGQLLYTNPAIERMFGYAPGELIGQRIHLLNDLPPEENDALVAGIVDAIDRDGHWSGEFPNRRRDGSAFLTRAAISALTLDTGEQYYVSVQEDVTEQKRLEDAVRQAQKMEAIGQLAGGVAHDFNNILGAILGNAELALVELEADHPARECVEDIMKVGNRARDLVAQILTFGRRHAIERRVLSLAPCLVECTRLLRATIPAHVELSLRVGDGVPPVLADVSQIEQAVVNLCTNAWHALPGAVGRIAVSLVPDELDEAQAELLPGLRPGRYARLDVADDGTGIDPAIADRVLEPFFTTKGPGQGTGLGLSVVHGIVRSHDGAMRIASEPGHGTTVSVYLPGADEAVSEPPARPGSVIRGEGECIVLVDDEPAVLVAGARMIERLGYRVVAFERPRDAIAHVAAAPAAVDAVVTDLSMPAYSGLQLAEEALRLRPGLPVILCSGFVTDEVRAAALRKGIAYIVAKPMSLQSIGAVLTSVFDGRRRGS